MPGGIDSDLGIKKKVYKGLRNFSYEKMELRLLKLFRRLPESRVPFSNFSDNRLVVQSDLIQNILMVGFRKNIQENADQFIPKEKRPALRYRNNRRLFLQHVYSNFFFNPLCHSFFIQLSCCRAPTTMPGARPIFDANEIISRS